MVALQVNEYLLRDERIQNPVKDLRQSKGIATVAPGVPCPHPPLPTFNFRTKQGQKISVSNVRDITFYGY